MNVCEREDCNGDIVGRTLVDPVKDGHAAVCEWGHEQ